MRKPWAIDINVWHINSHLTPHTMDVSHLGGYDVSPIPVAPCFRRLQEPPPVSLVLVVQVMIVRQRQFKYFKTCLLDNPHWHKGRLILCECLNSRCTIIEMMSYVSRAMCRFRGGAWKPQMCHSLIYGARQFAPNWLIVKPDILGCDMILCQSGIVGS